MTETILSRLKEMGDPERTAHKQRFFKTGPGEYAEGDLFLGVRVPMVRKLVREFRGLPIEESRELLVSPWHEARLFALLVMVDAFVRGTEADRQRIYSLYMKNTSRIDNWDLVDSSAPGIVGAFLWQRDRDPLRRLAASSSLWERRIAMIATLFFIRRKDFSTTLELAAVLLDDPEDLIHKASGWMLREVGKRDRETEEAFLRVHFHAMPRTMLRYAIEKFPPDLRRRFMSKDKD